jgi:hypothetical protein
MTAWEYRVLPIERPSSTSTLGKVATALNGLGGDGWEAFAFQPMPDGWWVLFKRPKSN